MDRDIDIKRPIVSREKSFQVRVNFRWKKKICVQERDMAMEKKLLQRMNTKRQKCIDDYKDKMNKEIARMQSKTMQKFLFLLLPLPLPLFPPSISYDMDDINDIKRIDALPFYVTSIFFSYIPRNNRFAQGFLIMRSCSPPAMLKGNCRVVEHVFVANDIINLIR